MYKTFLLLSIILIYSCSNETIYSGKIYNQDNLQDINFINKENLVVKMGLPSFIDPIENKYFYFTEKKLKKSIFKKELDYSYIFVFKFDQNDTIIEHKVFDLSNTNDVALIEEETENQIVKRGLIEKVFGGVGPNQQIPTSQ